MGSKRLKGCVFSPPSLAPVPGARKRNLSIGSIPVCLLMSGIVFPVPHKVARGRWQRGRLRDVPRVLHGQPQLRRLRHGHRRRQRQGVRTPAEGAGPHQKGGGETVVATFKFTMVQPILLQGEEIAVRYLCPNIGLPTRQSLMSDHWSFKCRLLKRLCTICLSLPFQALIPKQHMPQMRPVHGSSRKRIFQQLPRLPQR